MTLIRTDAQMGTETEDKQMTSDRINRGTLCDVLLTTWHSEKLIPETRNYYISENGA